MGFEYEVDVEELGGAAAILSGFGLDLSSLSTELSGAPAPKAGPTGDFIGAAFTSMATGWGTALTTLSGEMTDLSKTVKGSTKMYVETEKTVVQHFSPMSKFAK